MDVYVLKDGRRTGPYQPFRLREMLDDGALTLLDDVWHEGMEKWQPLGETDSLRGVLRGEAPAVPDMEEDAPPVPDRSEREPELTPAMLRQRRRMAWRRFFARQMDIMAAAALVTPVLVLLGWTDIWSLLVPSSWLILLAPAAVWIFVESVLLHFFGATPGRWALGVRVESKDGGRPALGQSLKRSVLVWAGGLGFGLRPGHLLPIAQWLYGWRMMQMRGRTLWDHSAGTVVIASPLTRWHVTGIVLFMAGFTVLSSWLWLTAPIPARFNEKEREVIEEMRREIWQPGAPATGGKSGLPSAGGA